MRVKSWIVQLQGGSEQRTEYFSGELADVINFSGLELSPEKKEALVATLNSGEEFRMFDDEGSFAFSDAWFVLKKE